MAFPHKLISKNLFLSLLLVGLALCLPACFGAGGGGASPIGSPIGLNGPGGGANPNSNGNQTSGGQQTTGDGNGSAGETTDILQLGPHPSPGTTGIGNDPVSCHPYVQVLDSIDECAMSDHVRVRFRFIGHVIDKKPPNENAEPSSEPIRAHSQKDCLAVISQVIANLPPTTQGSQQPPCCQGQWVRIADENTSVYSQAPIGADGHFDITLVTKRNSDTTSALAAVGYPSDPNILPNVTSPCLLGNCDPDNFSMMITSFQSSAPFPDETNLSNCSLSLDHFNGSLLVQ